MAKKAKERTLVRLPDKAKLSGARYSDMNPRWAVRKPADKKTRQGHKHCVEIVVMVDDIPGMLSACAMIQVKGLDYLSKVSGSFEADALAMRVQRWISVAMQASAWLTIMKNIHADAQAFDNKKDPITKTDQAFWHTHKAVAKYLREAVDNLTESREAVSFGMMNIGFDSSKDNSLRIQLTHTVLHKTH